MQLVSAAVRASSPSTSAAGAAASTASPTALKSEPSTSCTVPDDGGVVVGRVGVAGRADGEAGGLQRRGGLGGQPGDARAVEDVDGHRGGRDGLRRGGRGPRGGPRGGRQ